MKMSLTSSRLQVSKSPDDIKFDALLMKEELISSYNNLLDCGMELDEASQTLEELTISLDFLVKNPTKEAVEMLNVDGSLERLFNKTENLITVVNAQEGFFGAIGTALKTFLSWVLKAIDFIIMLIGRIVKFAFDSFRFIHEGLIWCIDSLSNVSDKKFEQVARKTPTLKQGIREIVRERLTGTEVLEISGIFYKTIVIDVKDHERINEMFTTCFNQHKANDLIETFSRIETCLEEVITADKTRLDELTSTVLYKISNQSGKDSVDDLVQASNNEFEMFISPLRISAKRESTFYERGYTNSSVAKNLLKKTVPIFNAITSMIDKFKSIRQKYANLKTRLDGKLSKLDPNDPLFGERKRIIHNSVNFLIELVKFHYKLFVTAEFIYKRQIEGIKWFIKEVKKEPDTVDTITVPK